MGSTARAGWCWRRGRGWGNSLCEMDIQAIIDAIRHNRVRITDHADEEAQADLLSLTKSSIAFCMVRSSKTTRLTHPIRVA